MKKMYKENKAITIVGLVIIILVLLIITGITIAILVGNSGVQKEMQNKLEKMQKIRMEKKCQII